MIKNNITVTVTVDDRKVTLEGPEDFVTSEVRRLTSLVAGDTSPKRPPAPSDTKVEGQALVERELVAEKRPKSQIEMVAVLAFCLTENGRPEFTEDDIKKAYIRAAQRPPKVISQSLRDAKNKYDLIQAGSARGSYKLSPHGDRTVRFDMPGKNSK